VKKLNKPLCVLLSGIHSTLQLNDNCLATSLKSTTYSLKFPIMHISISTSHMFTYGTLGWFYCNAVSQFSDSFSGFSYLFDRKSQSSYTM